MTRLIARLILAMLILPVTGALFLFGFVAAVARSGQPAVGAIVGLYLGIYAFVAAYWILLWRGMVRWTRTRIWHTLYAAVVSIAVAGVAGALIASLDLDIPSEVVVLMSGGLPPIIWVLATVLIWRESSRERVERLTRSGRATVACPVCGYNMTGLHETRCPECGTRFTIDQLIETQTSQDSHTLSDE